MAGSDPARRELSDYRRQTSAAEPALGSAPEALPEQIGRYRILRRIGQGGMGSVYLAEDLQLGRQVALKAPHFSPNDGAEMLERFHREARSAAKIAHPNICRVYDVGEANGIHFLTMDYVDGKPLSKLIRGERPPTPRQAAHTVRKLALALHEAHRHGIIHRDLKPANVMIDRRGEPIVMDFGLARQVGGQDPRLTASGTILGTPAYMSPEQVTGDVSAIGPQSDVYSLGVILYELLAGEVPFIGAAGVVLGQILHAEPPPPSRFRPDLDPLLEQICLRAIAKRPADRFASMAELAEVLGDYLRTAPRTEVTARNSERDRNSVVPDSATPGRKGAEVSEPPTAATPRPSLTEAAFDPYHRWLGIPKDQRPPTHFQLLGIAATEEDDAVIQEAVIRQTTYLRTYQRGAQAEQCARLLQEVAEAGLVLLDPARRRAYGEELTRRASAKWSSGATDAAAPSVATPTSTVSTARAASLAEPSPAAGAGAPKRPLRGKPYRRSVAAILTVPLSWVLAASALAVLLAAAIVIRAQANKGTIVLESDVADVEVAVMHGGVRIGLLDANTNRELQLTPGEYDFQLAEPRPGLELRTARLDLQRGSRSLVEVRSVPAAVAPATAAPSATIANADAPVPAIRNAEALRKPAAKSEKGSENDPSPAGAASVVAEPASAAERPTGPAAPESPPRDGRSAFSDGQTKPVGKSRAAAAAPSSDEKMEKVAARPKAPATTKAAPEFSIPTDVLLAGRYTWKFYNMPASLLMKMGVLGRLEYRYDPQALKRAGVNLDRPINLQTENATVEETLRAIFQPLGVEFTMVGRTVTLTPAASRPTGGAPSAKQSKPVSSRRRRP